MAGNRPRGRQKNITGQGKSIRRRGTGLGNGPVGSPSGYDGRPNGTGGSGGGSRNRGGGGSIFKIIAVIAVLLLGGGGSLSGLLGNGLSFDVPTGNGSYNDYNDIWGNFGGGSVSTGWDLESNTGALNTTVVNGARDKYTNIKGNGKDEVTIMVYMCGTDLESRSKMATSDLQEMIAAELSNNVNVLVYTGGCKQWQNSAVSNKNNQIWKVEDGRIRCMEKNMGSKSMTDPNTLTSFIKWCKKNYPANRNSLIFWDHGSGAVRGFGYDEKFANSGSMTLGGIDDALKASGVKFDFVGFDACLMGTAENALMLTKHADYLIASEELEPGIGWYYTDWITELSNDPSMSTLEVGKMIVDDFVTMCARKCPGQATTLSLVDLAEVEKTIPNALAAFSADTYELIRNKNYAQISNARSRTKEFGGSNKVDQVDLVHLAENINTSEGNALAETVMSAVKYNRTSSNITNSYGLAIYFPYHKVSMVDDAVETYEDIGMDDEYARFIQAFASMEVSGQAVNGGQTTPIPSLEGIFGSYEGNSSQMMQLLLGELLSNQSYSGMDFLLGDRALPQEEIAEYLSENTFNGTILQWENGKIVLPEEQWGMVQTLHANMFYDDGEGYIDLGLDNVYEFDKKGNLLEPKECTWIAINEQPVAYYHENTVDDGENYSITGRVPVLYNGERAELILEFTDENPYGNVVGVRRVYTNGETEAVAKTMDAVQDGDVIDFVCDYYSYEGEYIDSYMFGEQLVVNGELQISDVYIDADVANLTYRFTDIYNQTYWTNPVMFR